MVMEIICFLPEGVTRGHPVQAIYAIIGWMAYSDFRQLEVRRFRD